MAQHRIRRVTALALAGFLAAGIAACSPRNLLIDQVAIAVEAGMPAFENDGDLDLLEAAFPGNIKLLEALLVSEPNQQRLLILLSRMYAGYGYAFVEPRLEAQVLAGAGTWSDAPDAAARREALNRYYLKGADYALRVLELRYPGCSRQLATVGGLGPFLDRLAKRDVPALFWYAFNLAAYVNQNRDAIRAVARAHVAQRAMQRVVALDETYYNGTAHLVLMVYHAARSPMMGGDPARAAAHYRKLQAVAGDDFMLAHVLYARYVWVREGNRQAFDTALERASRYAADPDPYPFFNAVAASRARHYLAAADRLFE